MSVPLLYKIAVGQIPRIGDINARKLIDSLGSVEAIFNESYSNLLKIQGIGETLARYICDKSYLQKAEKEIEFLERYNIKSYFYLDEDYPQRLKQCEDSPIIFFSKGNCNLDTKKIISIVGTRRPTSHGRDICNRIVAELSKRHNDLLIVSGLAYGIDVTAHKAALENDLPTVGVLAHGLKTIYPATHRSIAEKMINSGGLVSDFLSDEQPLPAHFVKRNRIIAGLADATLVIESAEKGGSLITADIAASYNRDVLAVPGRPSDCYSLGCNSLIKQNKAALVCSAEDIENSINWIPDKTETPKPLNQPITLSDNEKAVYSAIGENGTDIDTICRTTSIPIFALSSILLQMEMKKIIKLVSSNIYVKNIL